MPGKPMPTSWLDAWASSDPGCVARVGSVYGPGTWATWLLAMAGSLIALQRRYDLRAIVTLLVPICYVFFAAVDLLTQKIDAYTFAPMAAAAGVTYWGLCYLFLAQIFLRKRTTKPTETRNRWAMRIMVLVTSLVAAAALIACLAHVIPLKFPISPENIKNPPPRDCEHWSALFKAGMQDWDAGAHVKGRPAHIGGYLANWRIAKFLIMGLIFVCYYHSRIAFKRGIWYEPWWILLELMVLGQVLGTFAFIMLRSFKSFVHVDRDLRFKVNCLHMPCAPQRIYEADQAYSLCCALLLFVYEVGPDIWKLARKAWSAYVDWYVQWTTSRR